MRTNDETNGEMVLVGTSGVVDMVVETVSMNGSTKKV